MFKILGFVKILPHFYRKDITKIKFTFEDIIIIIGKGMNPIILPPAMGK